MSNMRLKSESTGNNYKKVENMCNDCSDDTGESFICPKEAMLESRIHVGDYFNFFVMLERKLFYTCKVLKDRGYENLLKD